MRLMRAAILLISISSAALTATAVQAGQEALGGEDLLTAMDAFNQRLYSRMATSVVFLTTGHSFGSGFFISDDGLVLTNAHVVKDVEQVEAVLFQGQTVIGDVIERADAGIDLALVQLPLTDTRPLEFADSRQLSIGAWVASVGHGNGGVWTFNTGIISNIYPSGEERQVFQTQIPLNPGTSGGPIVDRKGEVLGIVTAGIQEANSINFGIMAEIALQALPTLGEHCDCIVIEAPAGVVILVDGKMAGVGPRLVVLAEPKVYEIEAIIDGERKTGRVDFPIERHLTLE